MKSKKTMAIIMVLLVGLTFFAGCAGSSAIKSADEASEAVSDVSTDVEDVTSALEEIDQKIG